MFKPRPRQEQILSYSGGLMGVAAVPGSGKTEVLSALAARLVATQLDEGQEVLIVTLVNSAVDNFAARIRRFLQAEYRLLPGMGYRVRTLHGLAHDIVRERPSLVGLADDFAIADEREAGGILQDVVQSWLRSHPELLEMYLHPEQAGHSGYLSRQWWPDMAVDVARAFMRRAKDRQWSPEVLRSWLAARDVSWPLAAFCIDAYADYQRSLSYRGKVDFDDLVAHAIAALRQSPDYLQRLQHRWPFILEDEAQDSSELQQDLLGVLVGTNGRWVRVGDPNQAVYYTFTTANPRLLRDFLDRPDVTPVDMLESGRSARPIIDLANYLVDWTVAEHPLPQVREEALRPQHIQPTPEGDPQPNPPDSEHLIHFYSRALSPDAEVGTVVASLVKWVPEHPDRTVAILVPDNDRGTHFVDALRAKGLLGPTLLNSSTPTRDTAGILEDILLHLGDPDNQKKLGAAFLAWHWRAKSDHKRYAYLKGLERRLTRCPQVEDYLWPRLTADWLRDADWSEDAEGLDLLTAFRQVAQRWHAAVSLPIDQLLLTLAQDLFDEPGDLARAYLFAVALRDYAEASPRWGLAELAQELHRVASNERRFVGLATEDTGFDPSCYPGKVVVATMHRAKGLEWDRVHLTALNNYDFPSGGQLDRYKSEKWFVRDDLNLQAEALGQLEALRPDGVPYVEGEPSLQARLEYVGERLRLLYVGITRAKRELIATWNTGKRADEPKSPALAFTVLRTYWESVSRSRAEFAGGTDSASRASAEAAGISGDHAEPVEGSGGSDAA